MTLLQRQEGPPPKFGGILGTETDGTTHWPRGYGRLLHRDKAVRESRVGSPACLKVAEEHGEGTQAGVSWRLGLGACVPL